MRYGLLLLIALSMAGCSRDPATSTTTGAASAAGNKNPSAAADDTVAAVQQSPGRAVVALRFLISGKPAPGAAIPVRLDFTAAAPVAELGVRVEGAGVAINVAGATAVLSLTEAGKTVSHTVTVTPQGPGFSELIVHALPPGDGAAEIVYAIPLLAEAAAPAPTAK